MENSKYWVLYEIYDSTMDIMRKYEKIIDIHPLKFREDMLKKYMLGKYGCGNIFNCLLNWKKIDEKNNI